MTSTHSKACLNDSVTLTCTTDANPPAYEYRFYLNDQVVHTSSSGVYQISVPQSGNNTYKCEPKNSIGYGANATVMIPTKSKLLSFNIAPKSICPYIWRIAIIYSQSPLVQCPNEVSILPTRDDAYNHFTFAVCGASGPEFESK